MGVIQEQSLLVVCVIFQWTRVGFLPDFALDGCGTDGGCVGSVSLLFYTGCMSAAGVGIEGARLTGDLDCWCRRGIELLFHVPDIFF